MAILALLRLHPDGPGPVRQVRRPLLHLPVLCADGAGLLAPSPEGPIPVRLAPVLRGRGAVLCRRGHPRGGLPLRLPHPPLPPHQGGRARFTHDFGIPGDGGETEKRSYSQFPRVWELSLWKKQYNKKSFIIVHKFFLKKPYASLSAPPKKKIIINSSPLICPRPLGLP